MIYTDIIASVHALAPDLSLLLVLLHLSGVAHTGVHHRENLVRAMITGRKARHLRRTHRKTHRLMPNRTELPDTLERTPQEVRAAAVSIHYTDATPPTASSRRRRTSASRCYPAQTRGGGNGASTKASAPWPIDPGREHQRHQQAPGLRVTPYDAAIKSGPLGPVAMGTCRWLNWLVGLTAAPLSVAAVLSPLPGLLYTAEVTLVSRSETRGAEPHPTRLAVMLVLAALAAIPAQYLAGKLDNPWAISGALLAMIPFDALLLLGAGHLIAAATLLVPVPMLGRRL